jgi:glycosyltransferase involved in cell wall biosynthesis
MSHKISIVTPNYNMDSYLESTILSVLDNLESEDEYFIIDGGSSDSSQKIINKYANQITNYVVEKDDGYADAIAKGFRMASGDILCWINSGDLLLPGTFAEVKKIFAEINADFIFGDDFYIDENNTIIQHSSGFSRNLKSAMLYGGWTPLQDACFWKRKLYEEVGGIDPILKYAADYDLFLKMSLKKSYQYIPKTFSAFRKHNGQKSIAGKQMYSLEREKCRHRELQTNSQGIFMDPIMRFFELNMCRVRARLYPYINRKRTIERNLVTNYPCGNY